MKRILAAILLLVTAFAAALPAGAQSTDAKGFVERLLESMLSAEGRSLDISGTSISLTGDVTVERIEVRDGEDPWLVIEDLSLEWRPLSLFGKQLDITALTAARVHMLRKPVTPEGGVAAPPEVQDLGAAIIRRLAVDTLEFDGPVLGQPLAMRLEGSGEITADPVRIVADLTASRRDGRKGDLRALLTLDPRTRRVAANVTFAEGPGGVVASLLTLRGEPAVDLSLQATGSFAEWQGRFSLDLDGRRVFDGSATTATARAGQRIAVEGAGALGEFLPEALATSFGGRSTLTAAFLLPEARATAEIERLTAASGAFALDVSGTVGWAAEPSDLVARFRATDADATLPLPETGVLGSAALRGIDAMLEFEGPLSAPRWQLRLGWAELASDPLTITPMDLRISGTGSGLGLAPLSFGATLAGALAPGRVDPIPEPFAGPIAGRLKGTWRGGGGIDIEDGALTFGSLALAGSGRLDPQAADLSLSLDLPDLSRLREGLEGAASMTARVTGPWPGLDVSLEGTGSDVSLLGRPLAAPRLIASLALRDGAATGDIRLQGQLDRQPLDVQASMSLDTAGSLALDRVAVRSGSARADGVLRWPANGLPEASLTIAAPELRDLAPLLLLDISGALDAAVTLEGSGPGHRAAIRFTGTSLAGEGWTAARVAGDVTVAEPLARPRPEGTLRIDGLGIGALRFDSAELGFAAAHDGASAYRTTLAVTGPDIAADIAADVAGDGNATSVSVTRFDGRVRGIPIRATVPASLRYANGTLALDETALAVGAGTVRLGGSLAPTIDLRAAIRALPLAIAAPFVNLPGLAGSVSGDVTLAGQSLDRLRGGFSLRATGIVLDRLSGLGIAPVSATAEGTLDNGVVTTTVKGEAGPLAATATGRVDLAAASLDLTVTGRAGSRLFSDRLAEGGLRAEGDLAVDLKVSGPLARPAVAGAIRLASGVIGDTAGRFVVRGLTGSATLRDGALRIVSLSGSTGRRGRAEASGTVALSGDLQADLTIRMRNALYSDGSFVTARYDADLRLTGPLLAAPVLSGEARLSGTKIVLSELPRRAVTPADVKHINASAAVRRQARALRPAGGEGRAAILVDLRLRARGPVSVSGRGLNVSLTGGLRLLGPANALEAEGSFRMVRGRLALPARNLDFDRGTLTFNRDFDPQVNFVAVSRRSDATITLTVTGPASEPSIRVTSVPQLPEEEALARLIFDNSMLELSPLQIAQIASYVATVTGRGGGLLSGLQSAMGLDVMVGADETGQTRVGVAKQIDNRLSVGVEQLTGTNRTRLNIDLSATPNLKIRGSVDTDQSSRIGVFYEKDY